MFRGLLTAAFMAVALSLGGYAPVLAADPSTAATAAPSPILVDPLDPRAGEGASRVGSPLLAIAFVVAVGVTVAAATVVFVRVTRRT